MLARSPAGTASCFCALGFWEAWKRPADGGEGRTFQSPRSTKKTHPGDSCFAVDEEIYDAHIKNTPEGGKLTETSRQSMKDVFQDFTHSFVKLIYFGSHHLKKRRKVLMAPKNKQPQIFSEGGLYMCISHSYREKHHTAKEKADGHAHASRDSSAGIKHTEPTITVPLPWKGLGKVKEKIVKSETHFDMTSEEEHKSFDDAQHTQPQVFSEGGL
ncbi:uncharacterized protein LOC124105659 isoform X2 [Marmota monax]|uniref:uncharacterized protein LOC124105659 isoform X2 n=1 Tax=Marmota monax TaxID=9995 RepID=UPI001EB06419|nr:uncharacterized protein LOC124105659 isoform X2 [Marmota monax]